MYLINLPFKWCHRLSFSLLSDQSSTDRFEIKHVSVISKPANKSPLWVFEPFGKHASQRKGLRPFIYGRLTRSTHDQTGKYIMWMKAFWGFNLR